jgi:antitoxin CptB
MEAERSRLLWRCRRGIREMDIVLTEFLEQSYATLADDDKKAFVQLLDEPDLDILNWIMGKGEPEDVALKKIITRICESRHIG